MEGIFVPITLFGGLFLFLILGAYYRHKVYLAAIEKGQSLPARPKMDLRKTALVLIALGAGFSIATHVTITLADHHTSPLVGSIWGIVPILIGAALWVYWRMVEKEQKKEA